MLHQFTVSVKALKISKDFILYHRLWNGWKSMRWLNTLFMGAAILFGIKMFSLIFTTLFAIPKLIFGGGDNTVQMGFSGANLFESFSFISADTYKYILLFCTMSMVYHFGGRALQIIYKIPYNPNLKHFLQTQVRSFAVVLICYVLEKIITGISDGLFSGFGAAWFQPIFKFFVQGFMFGAIIIDGLNHSKGLNLKQSIKVSFNHYLGIALSLGTLGLLLSYIPVIGVILVGSIVSVAMLIAIKKLELTN